MMSNEKVNCSQRLLGFRKIAVLPDDIAELLTREQKKMFKNYAHILDIFL